MLSIISTTNVVDAGNLAAMYLALVMVSPKITHSVFHCTFTLRAGTQSVISTGLRHHQSIPLIIGFLFSKRPNFNRGMSFLGLDLSLTLTYLGIVGLDETLAV